MKSARRVPEINLIRFREIYIIIKNDVDYTNKVILKIGIFNRIYMFSRELCQYHVIIIVMHYAFMIM